MGINKMRAIFPQRITERLQNRTMFKVWLILVIFVFSLHAFGSFSRFSEISFKILDLRSILAADIVLLFIGIAAFAGQSKTANRVLALSLVAFVMEICLSYHLATRNGIWGFDAVLDFGATERISSEGWKGVGAYSQLFATYDFPALSFLASSARLTSSIPLESLFAIVPISLAIIAVVALLSLLKRVLPIRNAMLATLVFVMYPALFGGLYLLQTIGTSLLVVALLSLLVSRRGLSSKNRGELVVAILLMSLLIGHVLEPYTLLLLAVYGLFYVALRQGSKLDDEHSAVLDDRLGVPPLLIPRILSIFIVITVTGYWLFFNPSMLERLGGAIVQLYEQQPLGRQIHSIDAGSAYSIFLDVGEHILMLAFLGAGMIGLLIGKANLDRRLSNFLLFPMVIVASTEFLVLFRSLHIQIARLFLWAWLFLIGYAFAHIDRGLLRGSFWKILLVLLVVWFYGASCSTEVFNGYHRYNYERMEYKPYLLDSEIQAARWFNVTDEAIVGDQGAWHLLTAFTSAHVVVDIDAIDRGPDGIMAFDWFFFRYENLNLAFDAYSQNSTSISLEELAAIDHSGGIERVFDNGGAAIYRLVSS